MDDYEGLSQSKWECKCHVIFIPKCRRKTPYAGLRQHLGEVFRRLAEHKQSRIEEGHLMPDHVHMMNSAPQKYAVSEVIGFIKGKSAIHQGFWHQGANGPDGIGLARPVARIQTRRVRFPLRQCFSRLSRVQFAQL